MKLLNGKELAEYIKPRQQREVRSLQQAHGVQPKLAIVATIDHPVINVYMRMKQQYGADLGVDVEIHNILQSDAPQTITELNADPSVHGIIIQLPLENTDETDKIVNLVAPEKDVDALGDPNAPWPSHSSKVQGGDEQRTEPYQQYGEGAAQAPTQQFAETDGKFSGFARKQDSGVRGQWYEPATPMAILWLLAGYNVDFSGKKVLLIGRGRLVGAPLERMLRDSDVDVSVADRSTADLAAETLQADIIVTATGSPAILYSSMIKENAVVVDAGVAGEDGKTVGDLAPDVYEREDLKVTPVKGGVGPLTVCALFENVIRAAAVVAKEGQ